MLINHMILGIHINHMSLQLKLIEINRRLCEKFGEIRFWRINQWIFGIKWQPAKLLREEK